MSDFDRYEQASYVEALRSACARLIITPDSQLAAQIRSYPICDHCHQQPGLTYTRNGFQCLRCYELEQLFANDHLA